MTEYVKYTNYEEGIKDSRFFQRGEIATVELPEPYYEDEFTTIYCADNREILPLLDPVGLCITDPPYGIKYKGGEGGNLIHSKRKRKSETIIGDDVDFDPNFLLDYPHIALFGAQHYYTRLPANGTFHVWDKRGDYKEVHTADFDTVWVNRKEVGRIFRCVWRGLCRETEWNNPIDHPTQKPVKVMRWIIEMFPECKSLIDPFMGSGTTLVAAKDLGLKAIGIEISEEYCEIAKQRLRQGVLKFG